MSIELTDEQGKLAEASAYTWRALQIIDKLPISTSDGAADESITRHEIIQMYMDILALIAETWPGE